MKNNLDNEITKIKQNLDVLPHNNKKNLAKYNEYIDENIKKYQNNLNEIQKEIEKRYSKITNIKENNELVLLSKETLDYNLLAILNPMVKSEAKMNLDALIYKLHYFYKDNLDEVNKTLWDILASFKEVGIVLSNNDFNYNNYVNKYMKVLIENKNDNALLHKTFESLYWECPELISQIEINCKSIYYRFEKQINKFYSKKYENSKSITFYIEEYQKVLSKILKIKHNNADYLTLRLLKKDYNIMDYNQTNLDKLKKKYLSDIANPNNYANLINLNTTLLEYSGYLDYSFIIEDVKKLYNDKNTYKGKFASKLKEINKKESELFSLNKKLNKTGLFSLKENKKGEAKLKISNIITELTLLYKELDELKITEDIFNYLTDETTFYDILNLVSNNYYYFANLSKTINDKISIDELNNNILKLKKYLFNNTFSLINNIRIKDDKSIIVIIEDHYQLLNINITEDDLTSDNLEVTIKNINILINYYDLEKTSIDLSEISFALTVEKEILGKK